MGAIEAIVDFLKTVLLIIGNFLSGLVELVTILPQAISMLTYSMRQLPPALTAFALAFVMVSVVYLVIGR